MMTKKMKKSMNVKYVLKKYFMMNTNYMMVCVKIVLQMFIQTRMEIIIMKNIGINKIKRRAKNLTLLIF